MLSIQLKIVIFYGTYMTTCMCRALPIGTSIQCTSTFSTTDGKTCGYCPRGHYKVGDCRTNGNMAECRQCGNNTFQPNCNNDTSCKLCQRHCRYLYMNLVRPCSEFHDLKCECSDGYTWVADAFSPEEGLCLPDKNCTAGQGYQDAKKKCIPCVKGQTFSTSTSTGPCDACTVCTENSYNRICTVEQDAECMANTSMQSTPTKRQGLSDAGIVFAVAVPALAIAILALWIACRKRQRRTTLAAVPMPNIEYATTKAMQYEGANGAVPYEEANREEPYEEANGVLPYEEANGEEPYEEVNGEEPYEEANGAAENQAQNNEANGTMAIVKVPPIEASNDDDSVKLATEGQNKEGDNDSDRNDNAGVGNDTRADAETISGVTRRHHVATERDWRSINTFLAKKLDLNKYKSLIRHLVPGEYTDVEVWFSDVAADAYSSYEQRFQLFRKLRETFPTGSVDDIKHALGASELNGVLNDFEGFLNTLLRTSVDIDKPLDVGPIISQETNAMKPPKEPVGSTNTGERVIGEIEEPFSSPNTGEHEVEKCKELKYFGPIISQETNPGKDAIENSKEPVVSPNNGGHTMEVLKEPVVSPNNGRHTMEELKEPVESMDSAGHAMGKS